MTGQFSQTSVDRLTDELRGLIMSGFIRPGERVNIKALEARFGVSHIPIREALRKLESEGLIDMLPQRGAIAARVSEQELRDIYDLRLIIEPVVAHRAAQAAGPAEHAAVIEARDRLVKAEKGDKADKFYREHAAFHWALLAPGATAEIKRVHQHLARGAERYIRLTHLTAAAQAHAQHDVMVSAFVSGDADELKRLVSAHLMMTSEGFHHLFASNDFPHLGLGG